MSTAPPKVDSKHAEKGFEGATVKDLADEAGVNVSLVSYHFGGKDGLYRACILQFAQARLDSAQRILKAPTSHSELQVRLRLFADELMEVHIREPDLCKIIHRDVEKMTELGEEVMRHGFFELFLTFVQFLKSAEKAKLIGKFKDYEQVAILVFGSLIHLLNTEPHRKLMGRPSIHEPKYREEVLNLWTEMSIASLGSHPSRAQES
jgi:AcrR family transcriptional regulator